MNRAPKIISNPIYRQPSHSCDPQSFDTKHLRFRFDLMDLDHDLWGWEKLSNVEFIHFFKFVRDIEKQTWAQIKLAAGGKKRGTNHHSLEISKFDRKAQKRLQELNLHHIIGDTLFSLRLNNITRIYGAREEEYFRPIWHDPHHNDRERAAYPIG